MPHVVYNTVNGLYVSGNNEYGQLGLGDRKRRIDDIVPVEFDHEIISFHPQTNHTILNTSDGIYVFGNNQFGQLGLGNYRNCKIPTKLQFYKKIISIHASFSYTIFVTTEGVFFCGQLGLNKILCENRPMRLDFDNEIVCDIINVCLGTEFIIFHTTRGIYVLGSNKSGQLGLGDFDDRRSLSKLQFKHPIISINCSCEYTMINTVDGIYAFGSNRYGQLCLGDTKSRNTPTKIPFDLEATSIHCGEYHVMINTRDGVFACGKNHHGELGLGDINNRYILTKLDFNKKVCDIRCCHDYTLISTIDNVYVCGSNFMSMFARNPSRHITYPITTQFDSINIKFIFTDSKVIGFTEASVFVISNGKFGNAGLPFGYGQICHY